MKKQFSIFMLAVLVMLTAASFTTTQAGGYRIGDKAMDFSLKNVDGKMVSLKDYGDAKGIIVVFTCNHCPFAKKYEDRIIALNTKYAGKGYPVVAIQPNDPKKQPEDSYEEMQKRAKEKSYAFPYVIDETQQIAKTYGAQKTPHIFLLKKVGANYIVSYIGGVDDNPNEPEKVTTRYVEAAVDNLLAGKPVANPETKAIGCSIKWREV
jgi:peroxiredoxin